MHNANALNNALMFYNTDDEIDAIEINTFDEML